MRLQKRAYNAQSPRGDCFPFCYGLIQTSRLGQMVWNPTVATCALYILWGVGYIVAHRTGLISQPATTHHNRQDRHLSFSSNTGASDRYPTISQPAVQNATPHTYPPTSSWRGPSHVRYSESRSVRTARQPRRPPGLNIFMLARDHDPHSLTPFPAKLRPGSLHLIDGQIDPKV
jgi:hypothetical protein